MWVLGGATPWPPLCECHMGAGREQPGPGKLLGNRVRWGRAGLVGVGFVGASGSFR